MPSSFSKPWDWTEFECRPDVGWAELRFEEHISDNMREGRLFSSSPTTLRRLRGNGDGEIVRFRLFPSSLDTGEETGMNTGMPRESGEAIGDGEVEWMRLLPSFLDTGDPIGVGVRERNGSSSNSSVPDRLGLFFEKLNGMARESGEAIGVGVRDNWSSSNASVPCCREETGSREIMGEKASSWKPAMTFMGLVGY